MKRFIYGDRNGIYIIDLQQTLQRIETAYTMIRDTVADGGNVLFVGTKKQAQDPIQSFAEKSGSPYINQRVQSMAWVRPPLVDAVNWLVASTTFC